MTAPGNLLILLVALSLSGMPLSSHAQLPVDPNVIHGNVTVDTAGSHMSVTNSPGAIINWQSFSIGANESVHFQQQNAASQVLNRVSGNDPSHIFGQLSSNGGVWLINPHGVLFGQNARIDVAGLVASTLDISNLDFMANRYRFNTAGGAGEIRNQGEIRTTLGGRVWLTGDRVYNEGLVETPGGNIVLAAGKSIELIDSGAPNVIVRVKAPENEAVNLGSLVASSGNVDLHGSIVNQAGIVRANSIGTDTTGRIVLKADQVNLAADSETQAEQGALLLEASITLDHRGEISGHDVSLAANEILQQGRIQAKGGKVTLTADASTYLDGSIDVSDQQGMGGSIQLNTHTLEGVTKGALHADGEQGGRIRVEGQGLVAFSSTLTATGKTQGGQIEVTGDQVLLRNASVDVSGGMQGGSVHLGGGWQGKGDLPHARAVLIDAGSEVKANGSPGADARGGEITVWSTQSSRHYGSLQAKDGGRIELSSKGEIRQGGDLQVGISGTILFDPKNLIITDSEQPNFDLWSFLEKGSGQLEFPFDFSPAKDSYITPDVITGFLDSGISITLQANNDITVESAVNVDTSESGLSAGDFTLQAGRYIAFNASIGTANGNLTAIAGDPGADAAYRDPGIPLLTINEGVSLDVGSGTATLAAVGGNFINHNSDLLTASPLYGRWLIYAANPDTSRPGNLSDYSKRYDQPFVAGIVPEYAGSDNWFLYSIAPVLSVNPSPETMTYGDNIPIFTPTFAGFINEDTQESADITGTAAWNTNGPFSSAGHLVQGVHNVSYAGGLVSSLGYRFADDAGSNNELIVNTRSIAVEGFTASDKIYDGGIDATISNSALVGLIAGDSVSLTGTGAFNDKHAGTDKPVTLTNAALIGADRLNYTLNLGNGTTTTANITPRSLTATGFSAENKVYDGTTAAQLAGNSSVLEGVVAGDSVSVSGGTVAFNDKHVGTGKPVVVTGVGLMGADSGNYTLGDITATTADITPREITVGSLFAESKIYDGTVEADVSGMLVGTITEDSIFLSGTGTFDDKHAGTGKVVTLTSSALTGADRNNYRLNDSGIGSMAAVADIFPRLLTVSNFSAEDKVYDGHTLTRVSGMLPGIVENDSVFLTGTGHFEDANAGVNKMVTVSDVFLSGADNTDYLLDHTGTAVTVANITSATLTYFADQTTRLSGAPATGLSGTVAGFMGDDTLTNATTGVLAWTTPATGTSPEGIYPIYGSGLSAANYVFTQAAVNDHALALQRFDSNDGAFRQETIDTSIQGVNTAISGTNTMLDVSLGHGRVIDMISPTMPFMMTSFGRLSLTNMDRKNMQWLVSYRKAFKEKLFADAISQLELDPTLADVPLCTNLAEINAGSCRISHGRRKVSQSSSIRKQQPQQPEQQKSRQKTKVASIPQIERKFAVLFGIDRYTDSTIPSLENAITDAGAIGRLFTDKLGYEIHIVNNAKRADIIRTLNQLAVVMEPDDSLVIYYAGHGYFNEKTGGGYWIPSDASARDPASWISNVSISEMLSGIRSKQMVMIADSCYSGTFTKEQKISSSSEVIDPADVLAKRSVVVMSSGGDEPVADEGRNGHSIFAWYLMQALYDVDRWQAGYSIFEQVQHEVKRSFPQTPQYGAVTSAGHEAGDYLFEFRQLEKIQ